MHRLIAFGPYCRVNFLSLLLRSFPISVSAAKGQSLPITVQMVGAERTVGVAAFSIDCAYVHLIPLSFQYLQPSTAFLCPPVQRLFCPFQKTSSEFYQGWNRHSRPWSGEDNKGSNSFYPDSPYFIPFPFIPTFKEYMVKHSESTINVHWYTLPVKKKK